MLQLQLAHKRAGRGWFAAPCENAQMPRPVSSALMQPQLGRQSERGRHNVTPSGLLGDEALKRRLLPQLRLLRVEAPVTGFTPSATLHSACVGWVRSQRAGLEAEVVKGCFRTAPAAPYVRHQASSGCCLNCNLALGHQSPPHHLLRLVNERVGEVGTVDVGAGQVAAGQHRALRVGGQGAETRAVG